jgi:hypothetical protein
MLHIYVFSMRLFSLNQSIRKYFLGLEARHHYSAVQGQGRPLVSFTKQARQPFMLMTLWHLIFARCSTRLKQQQSVINAASQQQRH